VEDEIVEEEKSKRTRQGGNKDDNDGWEVAGQDVDEDEDEDEDYDDTLLFLPTGLSRPRPKTFYRGSDPEWQEFRKLASDRPRAEKIRGMGPDST